jgi:hypothetical protein
MLLADCGYFGEKFLNREEFASWAVQQTQDILRMNDPLFGAEGDLHPITPFHMDVPGLGNSRRISVGITLYVDHLDETVDFSHLSVRFGTTNAKSFVKDVNGWDCPPVHLVEFERDCIRQACARQRRL